MLINYRTRYNFHTLFALVAELFFVKRAETSVHREEASSPGFLHE